MVTHEQPDFDALASLALARLAHPGSVAVIGGDLSPNIRAFLRLYRDQLDLAEAEDIDLDRVSELIVVDTNDAGRIGPFAQIVDKVPVTLYDHHPRHENELRAAHGVQEQVGAAATLLTRHLQVSSIDIPPQIASLGLLGIHEDTGNLTFGLTTVDDYLAAAHLLSCGASLNLVREYQTDQIDGEQRQLLKEAGRHLTVRRLGGFEVVTAAFSFPHYVRNAAIVCNRLLEQEGASAALLAVEMEGKTLVFARSLRGFDVGASLAQAFDGGGHRGAAFARTDLPPQEALEQVLAAMLAHSEPAPRAGEIMSRPVKTLAPDTTVHDAQSLLSLYGHNGAPVVDGDGRLLGVVSRRDLERAVRHDLAQAPVSGFMTREVVSAPPTATLMELEDLVEEHNVGRIPIVEEGRVTGIVTRTDLLAARHPPRETGLAAQIAERLPGEARRVVERARDQLRAAAGRAGPERQPSLYLVGGTVRDALLGRALIDMDLVLEGFPAERLVASLQSSLGGSMSYHAAFGTSTLALPSSLTVDIAGAREEYYPHPGALPEVAPAGIRKDLARRDFTINAMAVRLHPEPFELIDPFDGRSDLERRQLRTLHPLSFIEDPTRILRGARLAGRLGFGFAPSTRRQALDALDSDVVSRVSRSRLRAELELTFTEHRVWPELAVLEDLGATERIYGLQVQPELIRTLDEARQKREVPAASYLLALLLATSEEAAERFLEEFNYPRRLLQVRGRVEAARADGYIGDERLADAEPGEMELLRALSPALKAQVDAFEKEPQRPRLRGRDVLELGLSPGPQVGEILTAVARARQAGEVTTFDEELELARRQVTQILGTRERE